MSTLLLSGWAQPADALSHLAPGATQFDYSDYPSFEAAIDALSTLKPSHVVAWSTGGQLALRALVAGAIKPAHLTLIAAPVQFVSAPHGPKGMDPLTYQLFRDSYAKDPTRTRARFHALVAKGDRDARKVMGQLRDHPEVENTDRWLPWLEAMAAHKLDMAGLASIPPTLIIHGMNDQVVPLTQSEALVAHLPNAQLNRWAEVGHAPHLHDAGRLMDEMAAHRRLHEVA